MLWMCTVAVELWSGQAYVMNEDHRCIFSMTYWTDGDTMARTWGPSSCVIMHGPMFQGSTHNPWKLKTSQFLHGRHSYQTCHPLSMIGMPWISIYNSVLQFLPISSNFTPPLKRSEPTFHRQQSPTWSTMCKGDVLHCMRLMAASDWSKVTCCLAKFC